MTIIEVQTRDRPVRLGRGGLLLDGERLHAFVELDDAVTLGVVDMIGEDGRALGAGHGAGEQVGDPVAIEDVVAEDQR